MFQLFPLLTFGKKLGIFLFFLIGLISCFKNESDITGSGNPNKKEFPDRVISLGPAITKEIFLLKAERKLVANTVYCNLPEEARSIEKIGDLINFNLERIVNLKPDLVIFTPLANKRKIAELSKLKIPLLEIPLARNFTEITENFVRLGEALGRKKQAMDIVEKSKERLRKLEKSVQGLPAPRVFFQIGTKPLATVSKRIYLHDCIIKSGGINIASLAQTVNYSYEAVVSQNPDVIIISSMGFKGDLEKKIWSKYITVNAVKNSRIHIVNADLYALPLPDNFVQAVGNLITYVHPEISKSPANGVKK
jgi:iron complex transport system substrate-binding protein